MVFTRATLASAGISRRRVSVSVSLSVCPSVCLSHAITWSCLRDPTVSRFDTIQACERHTHTHTDTRRRL